MRVFNQPLTREEWLTVPGDVCSRYNWRCHAYWEMTNHYHVVVETPDANLSQGMRQLNGVYTQKLNRRHGLVGHLFQGRYKGILVQRDVYLLELSRYSSSCASPALPVIGKPFSAKPSATAGTAPNT
jgi:putative transposase